MKLQNEKQDEELQKIHRNGKQRVNLISKLVPVWTSQHSDVKVYFSIGKHTREKEQLDFVPGVLSELINKKLPRPLSLGSLQVAWVSRSVKNIIRMKIDRL